MSEASSSQPPTKARLLPGNVWPWVAGVFVLGLALQILLFTQQWPAGDQIALLNVGVAWAEDGELWPTAKRMSGEGRIPGTFLQIMIGSALKLWSDYRAPSILVGGLHVLAALVVGWVAYRAAGGLFLLVSLTVYWLAPIRLYHAGMLWEPSFLYLFAAVHLAAAYVSREKPHLAGSFLIGLVHALTLQIHGSFLALVLLSLLLFWKRLLRVHPGALALGIGLGCITLLPTLLAYFQGDSVGIAPAKSFIGMGFLHVYPVPKSILYWVQYGSAMPDIDFEDMGVSAQAWQEAGFAIAPWFLAVTVLFVVGYATFALPLAALRDSFLRRTEIMRQARTTGLHWLHAYALLAVVAGAMGAGLSPAILQSWHLAILFHAASLMVALWLFEHWPVASRKVRIGLAGWFVLRIAMVLVVAFNHGFYTRKPLDAARYDPALTRILHLLPEDTVVFTSDANGASTDLRNP